MRRVRRRPAPQTSKIVSTPAPFKGLADVFPIASMPVEYALVFDNFIAKPEGPSLRQGAKKVNPGFTTPVTSFLRFNGRIAADNKLFAISGGKVFDVTAADTIDPTTDAVISALSTSNVWWESVQQTYTTANHNYMIAVNGADMPLLYNGSWSVASQVASPAAPGQFTTVDQNGSAVNIALFKDVHLHQQRLWFVPNTSTKAYYTTIGAIGGQLYAIEFGHLFPRGGHLHKLATLTMDAGGESGVQAVLVAISSKGDVVIFEGNDPSSASTWRYIATYHLGAPIGQRCTKNFEGDLLYLSVDGLFPLSKYIQNGRTDQLASITYPISNTVAQLVQTFATSKGFEIVTFPGQNVLMLNVPQVVHPDANIQYVMHTTTRGWARFLGWGAYTFCDFNDSLYFGGSDCVYQAFSGYADNADADGGNGDLIIAYGLQAFTSFPDTLGDGVTKTVVRLKPYITTGGSLNPTVAAGINVDFDMGRLTGSVQVASAPGAVWDNVNWDSSATWVGASNVFNQWFSPSAKPGNNLACAITISGRTSVTWSKTQWDIWGGLEY